MARTVRVRVRVRARVGVGVRVRDRVKIRDRGRGLLRTTSHYIYYGRVGPIDIFRHWQP